MLPIRIKACSESDLRMLGDLAHNIQRVLPVTQADIDAAAALGKEWVVWKVIEVTDPIDNLRGGTQLVIKQNSITPGQNVRRVLIVQGPGGETVVIGPGPSPLLLPDAIADSLSYVKAFGGTEQRNLPDGYTQLEYIKSSGTQYIDTGVVMSNDVEFTANVGTTAGNIAGITAGGANGTGLVIWQSGNYFNFRYYTAPGVTNTQTTSIPFTLNTMYNVGFNINKSSFSVNGQSIAKNQTIYNAGVTIRTGLRDITASLKIWNNGVLVRNFIPAKDSNNVIGMYDTVNGVFYENQGTGDFVAGPTAVPTPTAPIPITCNNGVLKLSPNLFDKNDPGMLFSGYLSNKNVGSQTSLNAYDGGDKTVFVKVEPNTTYTVTRATNLGSLYDRIRCAAFTTLPGGGSTGVILYNVMNSTQANATFTTLSDTQYVAINVRNSGAVGDDWQQYLDAFQLEQGSTATTYRPYGQIYTDGTVETIKDSLNNTATAEMLLKVGNYQDVQSIIDGVVTRNVGVKVFDGTENWMTGTGGVWYNFQGDVGAFNTTAMICSHYSYAGAQVNIVDMSQNQFSSYANGNIAFKSAETTSADDFKTWLADKYNAGTPVMVVYAKTNPATESVTGQTLQVTDGDNTLEITQASLSNLELEAEYKKV